MMGRIAGGLLIAALTTTASSTLAGRQFPAPLEQPVGPSRLTGQVVAADDGAPVARAYVVLSGVADSERNAGPQRRYVNRAVETDAKGAFDFPGLPAGSYFMQVQPLARFVAPSESRPTIIREKQNPHVTIRLERTGAIEGRVQDKNGEPVFGAAVHAVRRVELGGQVTLSPSNARAVTDDRGEYRLFNLTPGDYYVLVSYTAAMRPPEPLTRQGYADTFYPSAPAPDSARPVAVLSGQDRDAVVITLAARRLVNLFVTPIDPTGGVPNLRTTTMSLSARHDVYLSSSTRNMIRRDDGVYMFPALPPGEYRLFVTTDLQRSAAFADVTIADRDVTVKVQTNLGARVSGRVVVDGRPAGADAGPGAATVSVSAQRPPGMYGPGVPIITPVQLRGTDQFELTGLRGPMVLRGDIGTGTLVSMRRGDEEIGGKTIDFVGTETIDDVVIELTTQVAALDVEVLGTAAPEDPEPVLIVLFAEDRSLWRQGRLQYATAHVSRQGPGQATNKVDASAGNPNVTQMIRMVPGRYLVAAIRNPGIDHPTHPSVLEAIRPIASPVTLVAGQPGKISIPVSQIPR